MHGFLGLRPHRLERYKPFLQGKYEREMPPELRRRLTDVLRAVQRQAVRVAGDGVRLGMSATGRSAPGPIAFFLPSVRGGGAQRVVVNLIQGITERGIPVDLVLATATGPFLKQLPAGVRLVDLRSSRLMGSLAPLVGYLRRERPRVVVSSMTPRQSGDALGRAACRDRARRSW